MGSVLWFQIQYLVAVNVARSRPSLVAVLYPCEPSWLMALVLKQLSLIIYRLEFDPCKMWLHLIFVLILNFHFETKLCNCVI